VGGCKAKNIFIPFNNFQNSAAEGMHHLNGYILTHLKHVWVQTAKSALNTMVLGFPTKARYSDEPLGCKAHPHSFGPQSPRNWFAAILTSQRNRSGQDTKVR